MTEIPLPGDYGSSERQPEQKESKGCCARVCECWLQLLCAFILFVVVIAILLSLPP